MLTFPSKSPNGNAQKRNFNNFRIEVKQASRGLSAIAELLVDFAALCLRNSAK